MRRAALLLAAIVMVAVAGCSDDGSGGADQSSDAADTGAVEPGPGGRTDYTLRFGGRARTYGVSQPRHTEGPLPLVVGLHGGFGEGDAFDTLTDFESLADEHDFLVAYPNAVDGNWNDGREGVDATAFTENVDDVGFLTTMIEEIAATYPVDPDRVYMAGFSNGAMMTNRYACERAEIVAAIAMVAGTQGVDFDCAPAAPVSIIDFHGTDDLLVPYGGGFVTVPGIPDDDSSVVRRSWDGCDLETAVVFYRVEGGGHTWPSGPQYLAEAVIGPVNHDLAASEVIWEFFAEHPKA